MRIKFLAIIAGFLFMSIAISSCLDSDNTIELSSDATVHAFGIDTIHGKYYTFTIDQLKREIYNRDSLPVGADTIVDRILIDTFSVSGWITAGINDTVFIKTDSVDLRPAVNNDEGMKFRVHSPAGNYKEYTLKINIHKQDPDSMQWVKMETAFPVTGGALKAVLAGDEIWVYANDQRYTGEINENISRISWQNGASGFLSIPTSIVNFKGTFYATYNDKMYSSSDGISWTDISSPDYKAKTLLAAFSNKLTAVNTYTEMNAAGIPVDSAYFCKTENGTDWVKEEPAPQTFSVNNVSVSKYLSLTGIESAILVGTPNKTNQYTVPWFTTLSNKGWADLPASAGSDTPYPSCPYLENPSIIHYGDAFYIFGGDFSGFYKSLNSIAWYPADNKFWMPKEFKEKSNHQYSMVVDAKNYIWIIWSDGEVWRGRLNKLGFKIQ